ncbi:glutamine-hydrolyzing GMP synthase [Helcococcus bovis]|uniref:glutamine-hydrolyzing GMP synthase n=1 Tax=Helcococcus bovis TaxID=3153252 RepID=UPI0038BA5D58
MEVQEKILILDFGGQYKQLIARRVREANVYCEVHDFEMTIEEIKAYNPKGIIFTGGPNSVYEEGSPQLNREIFELGVPILGICYGCQLMMHSLGGEVIRAEREYGEAILNISKDSKLFKDVKETSTVWMSHTDRVEHLAQGFEIIGSTKDCKAASLHNESKSLYGVQFHPEVFHSEEGCKIIKNFLFEVCQCSGDWKMDEFSKVAIKELRNRIGDKKVLLALSGGVDSSVVAAMLSKAIGNQLTCIFVDHGLLRKDEGDQVEEIFTKGFDLNFIRVNAQQRYYEKLKGVTDPEKKRKIIGEEFIRIFEEEAKKLGAVDYLAQGTIYADVIESGTKNAQTIKSHHNVGGLPENIEFKELVEPLRDLFKDEVRSVGRELGLPEELVSRQPFPGPGLGVRILGEVTEEKVKILQEADYIYREELRKSGVDKNLGQYFAALTNMKSVGVMGDERTYDYAVALRAVNTTDFMTADTAIIPWDVLIKVTNRIVNEVEHVNRVLYDCTGKPPATIEFE